MGPEHGQQRDWCPASALGLELMLHRRNSLYKELVYSRSPPLHNDYTSNILLQFLLLQAKHLKFHVICTTGSIALIKLDH